MTDKSDLASRHLNGTRLRLARLARSLPQAELADMAGVTRQAVAGLEAGRWDPSLRVALALARGLGVAVEDIFGPRPELPAVDAELLVPAPEPGVRVELAHVGTRQVALPLVRDRTLRPGFGRASGITGTAPDGQELTPIQPTGPGGRSLVVAGCDPAIPLLAEPLARLAPPIALSWWPCSTRRALELAASGLVHVAGVHLDLDLAERGIHDLVTDHLGSQGAEVIGFASWQEGLVWDPSLGDDLDLVAAVERDLRLVNREPGSEARSLLDATATHLRLPVTSLRGYQAAITAHLLVTSAVSTGIGQFGISTEPCAIAYQLAFAPLAHEHSHLVLPAPLLTTPEVQGLLRTLAGADLQAQITQLRGYDTQHCGELITTIHPLPVRPDPAGAT